MNSDDEKRSESDARHVADIRRTLPGRGPILLTQDDMRAIFAVLSESERARKTAESIVARLDKCINLSELVASIHAAEERAEKAEAELAEERAKREGLGTGHAIRRP